MGLGSRHLEEAGEGPPGTGWPVWRRWVGRQAACPVTVFLPSQPPHLAILPWEPGGHLQESHARDSLSEAPATCSSAAVGAVVGVLEDSFTFLGIFLAIVLFPFGFICCFALRKRRCPNCGANFT